MTSVNPKPIIISIEGNIGSGKTTFISELMNSEKMKTNSTICFLKENKIQWKRLITS